MERTRVGAIELEAGTSSSRKEIAAEGSKTQLREGRSKKEGRKERRRETFEDGDYNLGCKKQPERNCSKFVP